VHWSLARPGLRDPRWGGSRLDTRIAYFSGGQLRIVGGNGRGDRAVPGPPAATLVPPAWRPGDRRILAYATTRGRVAVVDVDRKRTAWISGNGGEPRALAWSRDGGTLAVASRSLLVLLDAETGDARAIRAPGIRAVAWAQNGRLAVLRGQSLLELVGARLETLFTAPGRLRDLAWSPNGRWLVTALPAADQWIFVSKRRVVAVSNIASQFDGATSLDGWVNEP
jgi:WD40 repeat protein